MKKKRKNSKIVKSHFRVTVFGSARIKKGDPTYRLVYQLAKMIAAEEMDLVTGGGPGLMDAASRGHHAGRKKAGVHSIGLAIHLPKEQRKGYHLDIVKQFDRFSERLDHFMSLSNVVVVAPGGVGTLLEFIYTWQLSQVKHICDTPIILLGKMWPKLIEWVKKYPLKKKFLKKEDLDSIFITQNCNDAMKVIRAAHEQYKKGKKKVCVNLKKYKLR